MGLLDAPALSLARAETLFAPSRGLVALGDSIFFYDKNNSQPLLVFNDAPTRLSHLSLGSLSLLLNAAVGGRQVGDMLTNFDSDTAGVNMLGVWTLVLGGTNDARSAVALTTTVANYLALIAKIQARGGRPVLCTIPPIGVGALGPPAAPTLVVVPIGGTLGPGTYTYTVTSRRPNNTETTGSATASVTIASGSTNSIWVIAPYVQGASGYGWYGRTSGSQYLLTRSGSVAYDNANAQVLIDTGALTPNSSFPPPSSDGTAIAGLTTQISAASAINAWLRAYCRANSIPLVPFHALLTDPVTGLYLTNASKDGTHPSPDYEYQLAALVLATIETALAPAFVNAADTQANDPTNFAVNPLMQTALTTNWVISNADNVPGVTMTAVVKDGFKGNAFQLHVPYVGTSANGVAVQSNNTGMPNSNFSAGDTLESALLLKVENSNGARIQVIIEDQSGTQLKNYQIICGVQTVGPLLLTDRITATANNIVYRVQVDFGGCDVFFGQLSMRNLTRLGVSV